MAPGGELQREVFHCNYKETPSRSPVLKGGGYGHSILPYRTIKGRTFWLLPLFHRGGAPNQTFPQLEFWVITFALLNLISWGKLSKETDIKFSWHEGQWSKGTLKGKGAWDALQKLGRWTIQRHKQEYWEGKGNLQNVLEDVNISNHFSEHPKPFII